MKYLQIGGKNRPFHTSFRVLAEITKGGSLAEIDKVLSNLTLQNIHQIAFLSISEGYRKEGKELDFDSSTVWDWLDEGFDIAVSVTELFTKQTTAYLEKATKKKKSTLEVRES